MGSLLSEGRDNWTQARACEVTDMLLSGGVSKGVFVSHLFRVFVDHIAVDMGEIKISVG